MPSSTDASSVDERRARVDALQSRQVDGERRSEELRLEIAPLRRAASALGCDVGQQTAAPRSQRASILMYHRIADVTPDVAGLCVPPHVFRMHMEYVAATCQPMALTELVEAAARQDIPERAVAITLDDGYLDTLTAASILGEMRLPATFFVNSSAGGETLLDSLSRIFIEGQPLPDALHLTISAKTISRPCLSDSDRRAIFEAVREVAWSLDSDGRRDLLDALWQWSDVDPLPRESHRMLLPAELRELASVPQCEIGGHTRNHLFLPAQTRAVKANEIVTNVDYLKALLRRDIRSFAYPYGWFDAETVQMCRAVGFLDCVTVMPEVVRPWSDRHLLPRQEIKNQSIESFKSRIDGLF